MDDSGRSGAAPQEGFVDARRHQPGQAADDGRAAQACVSAGNTGALMAVARYLLKTLDGIDRPGDRDRDAQRARRLTTVLDLGANVDCTPSTCCSSR